MKFFDKNKAEEDGLPGSDVAGSEAGLPSPVENGDPGTPAAAGKGDWPQEWEKAEHIPAGPVDFFDLPPDEVADHRSPGAIVARRRRPDLKPALGLLVFIVLLGALITGIVLIWPSSRARVPDLVGKTLPAAMDSARGKGFNPTVTGWEYSDKSSDGVVLSQKPAGRMVAKKGSGIMLTVSKGARPQAGAQPGQAAVGASQSSQGSAGTGPYSGKTITIDPGHQGPQASEEWSDPSMTTKVQRDNGTRGVATGNAEFLLTLDIGLKLKNLLEQDGVRVVMTRETSDIDLTDIMRAEIANNADSDLFLRVHCGDSPDPYKQGVDTICPANNQWTASFYENSKKSALFIEPELARSCGIDDLGVVARQGVPAFNWSRVPVVETEVGFLSNARDDALLADDQFRWKVAWGLRNGILKYLGNP
jgi:N-acetylmuramoyl-L-alanine amidase